MGIILENSDLKIDGNSKIYAPKRIFFNEKKNGKDSGVCLSLLKCTNVIVLQF